MHDDAGGSRGLVLLRIGGLMAKTGLSRSSIYSKLDANSPQHDPSFPRQVSTGASSVAWVEAEVDEWILSRLKIRDGKVGER